MKKEKYIQSIYFIFGIIAFCYVLLRAINVGITYDEVWSINGFVTQSIINILNFTPCDANNHIVNTLLIKLFFIFGNHSLFIARLPNVLAFILYLFYGYKITHKYLSPLIGLSCYLLLLLNPFLLDFFGIARGYGLSLSFFMISLYFAFEYVKEYKTSNIWWVAGFGAIAVLCNFSILNYWLVTILIINTIALFLNTKYNFKKTFLYSFCISVVLIAILYEPIRKLKANGNLYYGGNTSFYTDTLGSLAKYSFYSPETSTVIVNYLNIFLFAIFLSILVSFIFNHTLCSLKNMILSITTLCILSVVLQHFFFDTLYLIDRTALFFYPLLILSLCFSLNDFSNKLSSKIIVLIVIAFSINFLSNANMYKTATWYFDAHSKEILNMLNKKGEKQNR